MNTRKTSTIVGTLFKSSKKGALKRGFSAIVVVFALFAVFMAHYALSGEATLYDKVSAGNYIDTGLDKTKGISMDLVDKGLTHKVLEFEIASDISAQDIQLLIAENNFDANAGSLSKLNIVQKEEPVYENVCNPYTLPEEVNGSIATVENCTRMQTDTKMVEEEQWLPVEMKAAEDNGDASLSTFGILGKGKYRYSFNTPIVQTSNGWGNAGTVFLKLGSDLYADKQHSSEWNESFITRRLLSFSEVESQQRLNTLINFSLGSFMSAGSWESGNFRILEDGATEKQYDCANSSLTKENISCSTATANDYFRFLANTYANGSYHNYYLYYNNNTAVPNSAISGWLHYYNGSISKAIDAIAIDNDNLYQPISLGYFMWASSSAGSTGNDLHYFNDGVEPSVGLVCGFGINGANAYVCNVGPDTYTTIATASYNTSYRQRYYANGVTQLYDTYNISNQNVRTNTGLSLRAGMTLNTFDFNRWFGGSGNHTRIYLAITNYNMTLYLDDMPLFIIGDEEQNTSSEEITARTKIEEGIQNVIPSAAIYTAQPVYVRYLNGTQMLGTFDKVAVYGNQRWAFNYLTGSDAYTYLNNLAPSLYIWENASLTSGAIQSQVETLITPTLA